jgi:hypothetical protein
MYINVKIHFLEKKTDSLFCHGGTKFCYKNDRWDARRRMLRINAIGVISVDVFTNPDNRYSDTSTIQVLECYRYINPLGMS